METDGQGITTLIAGAGCPLNCRWCINKRLLREATAEAVTAEEETAADQAESADVTEEAEEAKAENESAGETEESLAGGGITFGGGEPLLHASFMRRFRDICPREWHICAETSLAVSASLVREASSAVDMFFFFFTDMNTEIYQRYTGGDGLLMQKNLRLLLQLAGAERITVRVPGIPEYNSDEDQEKSAEKLRAIGITKIERFDYVIRPDMKS